MYALYQGTSLLVPQAVHNELDFSPCALRLCKPNLKFSKPAIINPRLHFCFHGKRFGSIGLKTGVQFVGIALQGNAFVVSHRKKSGNIPRSKGLYSQLLILHHMHQLVKPGLLADGAIRNDEINKGYRGHLCEVRQHLPAEAHVLQLSVEQGIADAAPWHELDETGGLQDRRREKRAKRFNLNCCHRPALGHVLPSLLGNKIHDSSGDRFNLSSGEHRQVHPRIDYIIKLSRMAEVTGGICKTNRKFISCSWFLPSIPRPTQ